MFISPAYAQAAAAPGAEAGLMQFAPLVLIFIVFYFLLIRPQQKRMKSHKEMLGNIRRGDRVVTNGGIIGVVQKVQDGDPELLVEIAEGVKVKVLRDMVASVNAKTEPVSTETPATPANDASTAEKPSGLKKLFGGK